MEGFKKVYSELSGEITKMAVDAQLHFIDKEDKVINGVFRLRERGQTYAFIIAMTSLIGGMFLLLSDKDVAGYFAGGYGLLLVIGMFLGSRQLRRRTSQDSENEE